MYIVVPSKKYGKSYTRLIRAGKVSVKIVDDVVGRLALNAKLLSQYKDHKLMGYFEGNRECHIKHDLLLLYKIDASENLLVLINIGTHSQLFGT